jgi:hypothetical protein
MLRRSDLIEKENPRLFEWCFNCGRGRPQSVEPPGNQRLSPARKRRLQLVHCSGTAASKEEAAEFNQIWTCCKRWNEKRTMSRSERRTNDAKYDNAQPSLTVAQEQKAFSIIQPRSAPGGRWR